MPAKKKSSQKTSGPGRPRLGEQKFRREQVLTAAMEELIESGYEKLTMLKVARRANASKETLYTWFGDKTGLFQEMIASNADATATKVQQAFSVDGDAAEILGQFAYGLLSLLSSRSSIALNRAAMSSPDLALLLLQQGRYRVSPIVEAYLRQLQESKVLRRNCCSDQFTLLYGLVIRDTQIRLLLGDAVPVKVDLQRQAHSGVEHFLALEKC
jgi:AcrR family transcriptional regulator